MTPLDSQIAAPIWEGEAPAEPGRSTRVIDTPARQEPRPPEQRRRFQWEDESLRDSKVPVME